MRKDSSLKPANSPILTINGGSSSVALISSIAAKRGLTAVVPKPGKTPGIPVAAGALYPFFGLLLSPLIASAAMSLSSISFISNALRLRKTKL